MPDKPDAPHSATHLSARELILTLIDSSRATSLPVSYFVAAAELFDMDQGGVRVALARLVRDGSLISEDRGVYQLGSRAGTLQSLVRNWSRAEAALVPWAGDWITTLVGHLTRSVKAQVRSNERALRLFGFAELKPDLWVRPANLARDLNEIRSDLLALGLHRDSLCAQVRTFDPSDVLDPAVLWDTRRLSQRYKRHIRLLSESTRRLESMAEDAAARETLLVGRQVTRDILLDPFLPDALVDAASRRQMISTMIDYNEIGRSHWRAFYERHQGLKKSGRSSGRTQNPAA